MSIVFNCAVCGANISVDSKLAGKRGKCTNCGEILRIPNDAQVDIPQPLPAGHVGPAERITDNTSSPTIFSSSLRAILPEELPQLQRNKLLSEETVYHFAHIDAKGGGCANPSSSKQWILVTNKRILFEASVREGTGKDEKFVHQSGTIPMGKVSYVGTATSKKPEGCSQVVTHTLRINSSGGEIVLAIPTQQEAQRIQNVVDEILSLEK